MENVLTAFFAIFLFLFTGLTISSTLLASQETTRNAWQSMQARAETKARTHLSPVNALSVKVLPPDPLTNFNFAFRNDGATKLSDFADWDVFVEYVDSSDPAGHYAERLPLDTTGTISDSRWSVEGIYSTYLDSPVQSHIVEAIEPHIVNPGEVLVIRITLTPPAQPGSTLQVTLSTPNGVSTTTQFTPDDAPALVLNTGLTAARDGVTPISKMQLAAIDADDPPGSVVYNVMMPPRLGELSLGSTFTQLAIDNDLLKYNHTGNGPDGFAFTITDGKTIIGPFTFAIGISNPPNNPPMNLGIVARDQETVVIDGTRLNTSDSDNSPAELIYTVIRPPANGALNLGNTFTQDAINNGALTYTRITGGGDSFTFTVTDGQTIIGPFTFQITES